MKRIIDFATKSINETNRYSIRVKIGICYYDYTIRKYGNNGYVLRKNNDIVNEFTTLSQILTALTQEIQYYI